METEQAAPVWSADGVVLELLQRDRERSVLAGAVSDARRGDGRVVLVRGEPGIGKSALLRDFVSGVRADAHVLFGTCDDLSTPRPLEPFWDMAHDAVGITEALEANDSQELYRVIHHLLDRRLRPTILVLDDMQWADQATLDVVRRLARRISRLHSVLILSFREEDVPADHALRVVVGEVPAKSVVHDVLEPFSMATVAEIAGRGDVDELWRTTGGNPLFVLESIRSDQIVPKSVSEVVVTRLNRLRPGARYLVEFVSVSPESTSLVTLKLCMEIDPADLDEAAQRGLLVVGLDHLMFKHELIRRAVEASLPSDTRISFNQKLVDALSDQGADEARILHHAREAGAIDVIVEVAPRAALSAVNAGSYREALAHFQLIEPLLGSIDEIGRADLLDAWSETEQITGNIPRARELREEAVQILELTGSRTRLAASVRHLSILLWRTRQPDQAVENAARAVSLVDDETHGRELMLALADYAFVLALRDDHDAADQAIRRAHHVGAAIGTVEPDAYVRAVEAWSAPFDAHAIAIAGDALRIANRTGNVPAERMAHRLRLGRGVATRAAEHASFISNAMSFAEDYELEDLRAFAYMARANHNLRTGQLLTAEDDARASIEIWNDPGQNLSIYPLLVVGLAQIMRGNPQGPATMRNALNISGDANRATPGVHSKLAQGHWINPAVPFDPDAAVQEAIDGSPLHPVYDPALWVWLLGVLPKEACAGFGGAERLLFDGEWAASADAYHDLDMPFEQAAVLSTGDTDARLEALAIFDEMGARAPADRLRRELRGEGVSGVPAGRRRSTLQNPGYLTDRQIEVLSLMAQRLANTEIADALYISTRTAEHHVAAVMSKTNATSRREAVAFATDQGWIVRPDTARTNRSMENR